MSGRPLVLTPRAARWLYALCHTQGLGVQVPDLQAAAEAVAAVDAYVAKLPKPPEPAPDANGEAAGGARR
jgi:hypothetical protein